MEEKIVIKGEIEGSRNYFRGSNSSNKSKIDYLDFILKKLKRKKKSRK